ncbi:transmembrane protein 161A, partial [Carlito syrichta]|uniref:Transmembrane protein 161A n=1 Tax=Carlito syrichta TaxID=1868482 RepID=A0A3Q0DYU9_CARSF
MRFPPLCSPGPTLPLTRAPLSLGLGLTTSGPPCPSFLTAILAISLFRYKHPSEEELRALAGKQRPRGRKERWANGLSDEKPLSVPRDAPLQLETCPLTAVDALVLRFFLEYQWFVDFAVYTGGVYLFTEAYYYVLGPARETNIAVFWCLLTVAFSVKVFLTVTRLYFSAEEGGERSVCLTSAFLFLLLSMLVQVIPEETLELGLEPGLASMTQNLEPLLKKQGWDWAVPLVKLAIRLGLAVAGSVLGAFLAFPGLRLAQTHRDALTMSEDQPMLQLLLHTSFLSPLFILCLWTKPIARDFLRQAPSGGTPSPLGVLSLSDSAFDSMRLWVLVALCLLRLAVTRPHLQAYLCLAKARVERLRKEVGRIEAREIQRRVVRVYCYVTVVSLQYLTPLILTLNCTLLLKTLADRAGCVCGASGGFLQVHVVPAWVQGGGCDGDPRSGGDSEGGETRTPGAPSRTETQVWWRPCVRWRLSAHLGFGHG